MKVGDFVRVLAMSNSGDELYGEVVEADAKEEFCYVLFPEDWELVWDPHYKYENPPCEKIYMFHELELIP